MLACSLKSQSRVAAILLAALITATTSICAAQTAVPEASGPAIEYDTVSAALIALKTKPGVAFKVENGWDIATDEAAMTIWSFSPRGYFAYPAVVKRQVVQKGSQVSIKMSVHCEGSKVACDDLVRTFSRMNGFEIPQ